MMPESSTYSIELYDHEIEPDGGWSAELAREILEGPNTGLTRYQLAKALRTLRAGSWGDPSIYVEREDSSSRP